ncbi:MAG: ABC transporter permease [Rhodospirillaceae bacterium]|jgi:peptide/nickel transport system permease protein|nr:ABC transporter permease [Rhodospirillaceae bacterium]MBT5459096.1 ABC transporter permease [Rhodospirillaceae bacterium]
MQRYILHRILVLIPVLILVSIFCFSLLHLIPGDPIDFMFSDEDLDDAETRLNLEKELGLDQPIYIQYFTWLGGVLTGDFGNSIHFERPNAELILERFPATILLTIAAMVVSVLIAIPAGVIAAIKRNTSGDHAAMTFALLGISIPNFWLGILLIMAFSIYFPILPSSGYEASITDPIETLKFVVLPAITLGTAVAAILARMTRSEMLEEIGKEYVRTARAKGVAERTVIFKHTLKNAMVPILTLLGLQFANLLGGTVIVETVFQWPGVGSLVIIAIYGRDYPLVQALTLIFAVIFVTVNFFVDILYKWANPRITLE